jgi:hypothetical protein
MKMTQPSAPKDIEKMIEATAKAMALAEYRCGTPRMVELYMDEAPNLNNSPADQDGALLALEGRAGVVRACGGDADAGHRLGGADRGAWGCGLTGLAGA